MIKREFVKNNLLKVLNYLPKHIKKSNISYHLVIEHLLPGWLIFYQDSCDEKQIYCSGYKEDLIDCLIETIKYLDTIIPDFINNLINI